MFCWILDKQPNLCAAGTLQAKSDKAIVAIVTVLTGISSGDVTANEIYYHKKCLMRFDNKYSAAVKQETTTPDNPS